MLDMERIKQLEMPLIVQLGERLMPLAEVLGLQPGSIIELPKFADDELDMLINNKRIGVGSAVKVGENFGIKITALGSAENIAQAIAQRIEEKFEDVA